MYKAKCRVLTYLLKDMIEMFTEDADSLYRIFLN